MPKQRPGTFLKGNRHAVGADHSSRRLLTQQLKAALNETLQLENPRRKVTKVRALVEKLIELGLAGEVSAIREIFDRVDGKPKQAVDVSGELKHSFDLTKLSDDELAQFERIARKASVAGGDSAGAGETRH